jgi:choline dehydrogenase
MSEFDYIVVGAGAAGCALAARLTEDPAVRVLLLEAGPAARGIDVRIPAAFPKLLRSPLDWGYDTAPEPGLGGRTVAFPRGRAIGGSTAINAQVYTRGHDADFEAWADEAGEAWGRDALAPLFARVERTLSIEPLRDPNPLSRAFVAATARAGVPAGLARVTQRRGRRWSAADAYLRERPNLRVVSGAPARDLLWDGAGRVTGVAYRGGTARAREVVLCAGAIGTPHLLLRAGIGAAEHLRAHGIAVRHDLPGVGQGLTDHVLAPIVFGCDAPVSLKSAESPLQLLRYLLARRGMLTSNIAEALAFTQTSAALEAPDLELVFAPVPWVGQGLEAPTRHGFTIGVVNVAPRSRGQVALRSADPDAPPAIRPGYLSDPADMRVLVHGAELARRIAAAPPLQSFGGVAELAPTAGAGEDGLRAVTQTIYHPACTCRMGGDALAVLDVELRVHGVDGLRVADVSAMPTLPRAHPQAAAYVIGERCAELLAGQRARLGAAPSRLGPPVDYRVP